MRDNRQHSVSPMSIRLLTRNRVRPVSARIGPTAVRLARARAGQGRSFHGAKGESMDEAQFREVKQMLFALLTRLVIIACVAFGVLDYAVLAPLILDPPAPAAGAYTLRGAQCSDS